MTIAAGSPVDVLGVNLEYTDDVARTAVGTTVRLTNGGTAMYVLASGAITGEGYVVKMDESFSAALITSSTNKKGALVGVAQCAIADGDYGWVVIQGKTNLRVGASCAANAALNTTATGGQLDDDATTGAEVIDNVILTTARGGTDGLAAAYIAGTAKVGATL